MLRYYQTATTVPCLFNREIGPRLKGPAASCRESFYPSGGNFFNFRYFKGHFCKIGNASQISEFFEITKLCWWNPDPCKLYGKGIARIINKSSAWGVVRFSIFK